MNEYVCRDCGSVFEEDLFDKTRCSRCGSTRIEPRHLPKAEASDAVLCAVPIVAGNSYGIQFLCSACDFPKDETLTMDMKHCWNCGVKLDWSKCEY